MDAVQPRPLAVVVAGTMATGVELEAPIDDVTGLPLIMCPDCRDVRVFAATTMYSNNIGKRYLKCPRKNYRNVSEVVDFALPKVYSYLPKFHCLWLNFGCRGHVVGFGSRKNMWCSFMIMDIYHQLP
jgi:hypothetical protein